MSCSYVPHDPTGPARRTRLSVCTAAALGSLLLAAPAAHAAPAGAKLDDSPAAIYQNHCSVCHGEQGNGRSRASAGLNRPPRDFTAEPLARERMIAAVTTGVPGSAMVGWSRQLSAAQIEAVVDHVRSRFMGQGGPVPLAPPTGHALLTPAAPLPQADMNLPLPAGLRGDPRAGARLYQANCVACHGRLGDGQGPRAYFIRKTPRNFLSAESRRLFNRPALFAAISAGKLGTEMPAWSKVLSPQEIGHITEYVLHSFITGDPAAGAVAASAP